MIPAEHSVDTGMIRAVAKKTQNIREGVATSLVQALPKVSQAGTAPYSHVARMISDAAAVRGTAPNIDAETIRELSQTNPNFGEHADAT
jgi:hypothetical protein